jgi:hypothetical protein
LYLNTIHNRNIAHGLALSALDRCPSFSRYPRFIADNLSAARTKEATKKRRIPAAKLH